MVEGPAWFDTQVWYSRGHCWSGPKSEMRFDVRSCSFQVVTTFSSSWQALWLSTLATHVWQNLHEAAAQHQQRISGNTDFCQTQKFGVKR